MSAGLVGQYWRHIPGQLHFTENCTRAFHEAPARWKQERMGTATLRRAARLGLDLCRECTLGLALARAEGIQHNEQRKVAHGLRQIFRGR